MLNVNRLRILIEVAYRGSFSAAADALSYTQSAVSQQIAALEAETGVTLLERHAARCQPHAGRRGARDHAEGILARLDAAEASLSAIAGLRGGQLRVASFPTAGATLMPLAIAIFRASAPRGRADARRGRARGDRTAPVGRRVRHRAAVRVRRRASRSGPTSRARTCSRTRCSSRCRRSPAREQARLRLQDLRGEAWVQTSATSPCARHVVRSCHAAGFEPNVSFESDDYQTVQGLVAAGVGVALIPELALAVVREDIAIRALSPSSPVREVVAATPEGTRLTAAAAAMRQILTDVSSRFVGPDII
jgi:DNA-binding transcriptional LysR family regulator